MKLFVKLLEARNLKPADRAYAQLKLGSSKRKSSISPSGAQNPYWFEDFSFDVVDLGAELSISIWTQDRLSDVFHGRLRLPVAVVLSAERQAIPSSWYPLQKRSSKSKTSTPGELRISFSLAARSPSSPRAFLGHQLSDASSSSSVTSTSEHSYLFHNGSSVSVQSENSTNLHDEASSGAPSSSSFLYGIVAWFSSKVGWSLANLLVAWLSSRGIWFRPNTNKIETDKVETFEEVAENLLNEDDGSVLLSFFEDDGISVPSSLEDMPTPLGRGVLLSDTYLVSTKALNRILFGPESQFLKDLNELQKTTNLVEKPWRKGEDNLPKRVITYVKAATKLVSSVKATEEQNYSRVSEKGFVVDVSAITPDVPYGSTFKVSLQYCIFAGPNTSTGEKTALLRVSWDLNFLTSTMMKGFIEKGARQGLQESYKQYAQVLEKYAKPHQESLLAGDEIQNEEPVQQKRDDVDVLTQKNDWQLAREYFCSLRVCITLLSIFLVLAHIYRRSCAKSGLEVWKLDLPDTLSELILSALLGAQIQLVIGLARNFLRARLHSGSDYGARAKGNGWVLAVTLVEAQNLPAATEAGVPDPYVVFTCVGRTRTSSVKLQKPSPEWEEVFEFEPMEEAPSTMRVDVFDFEGPFTEAESVGHAEINFLKQKPEDLADLWIPLQGNNGRTLGSKVHLRIILATTKESHNAVQYIEKVEKEVGWKITRRTFVKNTSFQKLFTLPSEEFLVNNFSCSLKRKFLLQGRLFVSPRVLAFYSNIFGHKTRFVLLWEDIEEIKETSPSLGSSTILVFTKKCRAMDAQHGAKSVDAMGRFKFQFQAFIHYKLAFRTVKALWKYRTFSLEKRMEMIADIEQKDDALEPVHGQADASETFLGVDEANLEEVYSTELPLSVSCMVQMYEKENLEEKIAEKAGWLEYCPTPWESMGEEGVQQRQISFKLSKQISLFGTNVTCIQQKTHRNDGHACYVDEVLTLHDVPFGDYFQIRVRKEIEDVSLSPPASSCKVLVGVAWQKSTVLQCSISKNIFQRFTKHLQDILDISVREILELSDESCASKQ